MTMDSPNPANAAKVAQQIVAILINEDSSTRQRAIQAAMTLLGEAAVQQTDSQSDLSRGAESPGDVDLASFFNREGEMKPADYANLCAAYHFSQFGTAPFSVEEIKAIAADAGVILPNRVDMTFGNAAKKGKKLFQSAGKGSFKPTAAGGLEFAERWGVKPGRKAKVSLATKRGGAADAAA